jgi:tetratricopeptide (TPR) repeat protein
LAEGESDFGGVLASNLDSPTHENLLWLMRKQKGPGAEWQARRFGRDKSEGFAPATTAAWSHTKRTLGIIGSMHVIWLRSFCFCLVLLLALALEAHGEDRPRSGAANFSPLSLSNALLSAGVDPTIVTEIKNDVAAKNYAKAEAELFSGFGTNAHQQIFLQVLGGVLFLDSKYLESGIAYKKAEKYGPLPETARFTLAMSYVELKRNSWAREELKRLNKEKPDQPLYTYWLGRLDYDDQRFANAKANFRKALEADSRFVRAFDGIGLCEEAVGNWNGAEENYRTANALNREQGSPFAWPPLTYGSMLSKLSRYAEAKLLLNEAVKIDPSLAKAYYELGRVEEQTSNRDAAFANFKTASAIDPHDPSPVYALFRLYKAAGREHLATITMARFRDLKAQQSKDNH